MIKSTLRLADGNLIRQEKSLFEDWTKHTDSICWIDLASEDNQTEHEIFEKLGCHKLAIQDAQRLRHPPKFEDFDDSLFMLYRGLGKIEEGLLLEQLQIAIFVGERFIVTRHVGNSYAINELQKSPHLADYLKQPLLLANKIIHTSFGRCLEAVLDFEQSLADKEEVMQQNPNDEDLKDLIAYKGRLRKLRRTFNYHERLAANFLSYIREHEDERYNALVHDVQDLHDRADRIASLLNMYYEICGDLIEGYLSLTSHQLNRTMQILTVVTTIFVPLGFLAGVYGMNFDNIPELHNKNGYFYLLGTMGAIAVGALSIFKWKRWI